MTLMQEKRYDRITIQDIIDRADVGRSTFYAHYQDKEDLLVTSFGEMLDALVHHLALSPRQGASIIPCRELFQHVQAQEAVYKALVWGRGAELLFQKGQAHLSQTIERRLTSRLGPGHTPPVPLPIVADYISGALFNLLRSWLDQRMPHSPEHMETIFEQMVMPGVWTALGVERLPKFD